MTILKLRNQLNKLILAGHGRKRVCVERRYDPPEQFQFGFYAAPATVAEFREPLDNSEKHTLVIK